MTRFPESSRAWVAIALFMTAAFTASSARAQGSENQPPPGADPGSPPTSLPPLPPPELPPPALPLPMTSAPASPPAIPSAPDDGVEVRFKPADSGLTLLGIEGKLVPVLDPVVIEGPSTLHADYKDRSTVRKVGVVTFYVGLAVGGVMMFATGTTEEKCDDFGACSEPWQPGSMFGPGLMVVAVSALTGLVMASLPDVAHITVEPLALGVGHREGAVAALGRLPHQGAALTLHF
jgi:hypothetical protein